MDEDKHIGELLNLSNQLTAFEKLEMKEQLVFYINQLLVHDFNKLIQILYRVDVNEQKLKEILQANRQTDAALIIADILLKRQEEKAKTKEAFKSNNDIPEEDKW
jgi:hypothetical protein